MDDRARLAANVINVAKKKTESIRVSSAGTAKTRVGAASAICTHGDALLDLRCIVKW